MIYKPAVKREIRPKELAFVNLPSLCIHVLSPRLVSFTDPRVPSAVKKIWHGRGAAAL